MRDSHAAPWCGRRARSSRVVTATAIGIAFLAPDAGAQTIQGRLLDLETGQPISLGLVMMFTEAGDSITATVSDPTGGFRISSAEPGTFTLRASAFGYRETPAGVFELGPGGRMTVEYRLPPQPLLIDAVLVSLDRPTLEHHLVRNGFVRRYQRGLGVFITPHEIEKSPARSTEALLEGVPGVRVGGVRDGPIPRMDLETVQIRMPDGSACIPTVYVDGIWVGYDPQASMTLTMYVPRGDVEAIEVYRRPAEVPVEYSARYDSDTGTGCGVMVVWTKQGLAAGQRPANAGRRVNASGEVVALPTLEVRSSPPVEGERVRVDFDEAAAAERGLPTPWEGTFLMVANGDVVGTDPATGRTIAIPLDAIDVLHVSRQRAPRHALVRGLIAGLATGAGTWAGLRVLCAWSSCNSAVERPWLPSLATGAFVGVLMHRRGPGNQWVGADPRGGLAPPPGGAVGWALRIPFGPD